MRHLVAALCVASAAGFALDPDMAFVAGSKPNIVFALLDDWAWSVWPKESWPSENPYRDLLPNITEFVDNGLDFEYHYTCIPTAPPYAACIFGRPLTAASHTSQIPSALRRGSRSCPGGSSRPFARTGGCFLSACTSSRTA